MRISDWSSDVCSSDLEGEILRPHHRRRIGVDGVRPQHLARHAGAPLDVLGMVRQRRIAALVAHLDRGVEGGGDVAAQPGHRRLGAVLDRSEEHTSELQSLMRISYAVFCLKKKKS